MLMFNWAIHEFSIFPLKLFTSFYPLMERHLKVVLKLLLEKINLIKLRLVKKLKIYKKREFPSTKEE